MTLRIGAFPTSCAQLYLLITRRRRPLGWLIVIASRPSSNRQPAADEIARSRHGWRVAHIIAVASVIGAFIDKRGSCRAVGQRCRRVRLCRQISVIAAIVRRHHRATALPVVRSGQDTETPVANARPAPSGRLLIALGLVRQRQARLAAGRQRPRADRCMQLCSEPCTSEV